jgi:hypothetical protein
MSKKTIKIPEGYATCHSFPDTCPLCHHGIEPKLIESNFITGQSVFGNHVLELIFRCPRIDCQEAFIGYYQQSSYNRHTLPSGDYFLHSVAPYTPQSPSIPEEISSLSPSFVEIYSQSYNAEHYKLDQVAGAGYRKALEYLIKDYCILKNPEKADAIKEIPLSSCINTYVDDPNIKSCATHAAWLGNDEVHYTRKWEEKDIADLKILIDLTVGWIRSHVLTEKYNKDMGSAT